MYAGIEGTGAGFRCLLGTGGGDVRADAAFPTTTPDETLGRVMTYIVEQQTRLGPVEAVGIACFGPLEQGRVISAVRPAWQGFDLVGAVRRVLPVPVVVDIDVNAAAVAERALGAGRDHLVFVIVGRGTGIGAGALVGDRPVRGVGHPEMGHLPVARHPSDEFAGRCRYHGDCLEGLASGAAIAERWDGTPADLRSLPDEAIQLEAWYLAQLVAAVTYMLSPELVVIDGAVRDMPGLLPRLRAEVEVRLGDDPAVSRQVSEYVVLSALDGRAAALGALELAVRARRTAPRRTRA